MLFRSKKEKVEENSAVVVEDEEATKREEKSLINRRAHLVLLAQNQTGLNNLFTLVSKSYDPNNFYRYPRIDYKMLKEHNEGIIVSSACMGGPLSKDYWNNKDKGDAAIQEAMAKTIKEFTSIFGDRFYAELQWNAVPEQHKINQHIIKAAKEAGVQLVSTADSHYARPELFKDRELYKQLGWLGSKGEDEELKLPQTREDLKYELYPKNGNQMWEAYQKYSKAQGFTYDDDLVKQSIERTYQIAHERIESFYPDNTVRLPDFVVPEGKSADLALRELCLQGLKWRKVDQKEGYEYRLYEELEVIQDRGFSKYFLTMKAVTDEATKVQLVGVGRGSAAGSLVAYVLGITGIDPIEYGLLFSRFLRKDATDYPDIDYDVGDPMELKEILIQKWGKDVVVPISNYNTLQLRSLIKDISKLYGVDFSEVNKVTSAMLNEATPIAKKEHGITAGVYVPTFEEVKEYSESLRQFLNKYPQIAHHINQLHGQIQIGRAHV